MTKKQTPRNDGARKSFESGSTVNYSIDGLQHELGFYNTHSEENGPNKYINLLELAELIRNPYDAVKTCLPLITPYNGAGKSKQDAETAKFSALVFDADGTDKELPDYAALFCEYGYIGKRLAFTTSSHGSTVDRHGNPKEPNHYKIIIPLSKPHTVEEYSKLSRGLSLLWGGDKAQARVQQGFYAPNRRTSGKPYQDEIAGDGFLTPECRLYQAALEAYHEEEAKQIEQAKAKPLKPKPTTLGTADTSIIELINNAYSIEQALQAAGHVQRGKKWLSPHSTSGAAGGVILQGDDGKERFYSHHETCPLSNLNNGGHALDVADVICITQYGGDYTAMIREQASRLDPHGQKQRQRQHMAAKESKAIELEEQAYIEQQQAAEEPPSSFDTRPYDLFNTFEPTSLDLALLPQLIAEFAQEQSDLIGTDPAAIAVFCLGAAAACIDDRIKLQPKRHDPTWTESARLWIGVIGDPSTKKSPALTKAIGPVFKIDKVWRKETAKAHAEWLQETENTKKGESEPPAPITKRLLISDATVEKIGDILSKCEPRGILSYQDELSGWLGSMDAYRQGAGGKDKASWLEAYNGGYKAIDRINRGELLIENWSVSVIGGIQPNVIHQYAQSTDHDGMLQRFILVHAKPAHMGADKPINAAVSSEYANLIKHLSEVQPGHTPITLSEGAHGHREALDEQMHNLTLYHPNKFLTAALGKYSGLFARLLLVWHSIECYRQSKHPCDVEVDPETAHKVRRFMSDFLLPHAMAFYQDMDPLQDTGQDLARLILARSWERFTVKRDFNQYWRASRRMKPWEIDEVLDRLEGFGWIEPDRKAGVNERGRWGAYFVNPAVHELHAEKATAERERRKKVMETLKELKAKGSM